MEEKKKLRAVSLLSPCCCLAGREPTIPQLEPRLTVTSAMSAPTRYGPDTGEGRSPAHPPALTVCLRSPQPAVCLTSGSAVLEWVGHRHHQTSLNRVSLEFHVH